MLQIGVPVDSALDPTDPILDRRLSYYEAFTFAGTEGQRIDITLRSTAFDAYLYLFDPTGVLVAFNDDGGGGLDSRIVLTLTTTGTWTIYATSYRASQIGPFRITMALAPTPTPMPTPTPIVTPEPTLTPDDIIFSDDFEWRRLDRWASKSDKGNPPPSHMYIAPAAKRNGSRGLLFEAAGLPPPASRAKLWLKDTRPNLETRYRARFSLNLNTLAVPTSPRVLRLMVGRVAGSPARRPFELRLRYVAPNWFLYGVVRRDGDALSLSTSPILLPKPGWSTIEIDWTKSSGPGSSDGSFRVRVNSEEATVGGVDNDEVYIDGVQIGFLGGLGLSSTGVAFLDDFESRRQGDFPPLVLPTPTPPLESPTPTPTPTPVRFVDNGDGTVTDRSTGLVWEMKTGEVGSSSYCPGGATCADARNVNNLYSYDVYEGGGVWSPGTYGSLLDQLNTPPCFADACNWRLPTMTELAERSGSGLANGGIMDVGRPGCALVPYSVPCIAPVFGPTAPGDYMSSTMSTDMGFWDDVLYADFGRAVVSSFRIFYTNFLFVRAVHDPVVAMGPPGSDSQSSAGDDAVM